MISYRELGVAGNVFHIEATWIFEKTKSNPWLTSTWELYEDRVGRATHSLISEMPKHLLSARHHLSAQPKEVKKQFLFWRTHAQTADRLLAIYDTYTECVFY